MGFTTLALERPVFTPYLYVIAGVGGVLGACFVLIQLTGNQRGFGSLFWVWMVASGVLWGRGPAYASAVLGTIVMYLYFFPPHDTVGLATFLLSMLVAAYVTGFAHAPRRASVPVVPRGRFWSHQASGDYAADCAVGEEEADTFLRRLSWEQKLYALGWLVRDMIANGRFTGVEAGFFHRISQACLNSSEFPAVNLIAQHNPEEVNLQPGVVEADREVRPPPVGH
jgi:hypothetical protein